VLSLRAVPGDAVVRRSLQAELSGLQERRPDRQPWVLDVGGGSGAWAVPLASAGCRVTVVDVSPEALAVLRRRADEAGVSGSITALQGDVDALAEVADPGGADIVLGHGLLEVVDDPARAVHGLAAAVAPGGILSVLVAGRHAAALARALAGRLSEALAVLSGPSGRWGEDDPLQRRMDTPTLCGLLEAEGLLRVELLQGDGVFEALVPAALREGSPGVAETLAELEAVAAGDSALQQVATRLHAIARRLPAPTGD
jgi:SAM-dependent methyltransferase